ncbi:GNAT family N-acetyltransferase [Ferrimonas balearica]|uniref:GNAT family N-acetyltransferase n=1 Tax=Ferrimonas balearica TaxID=44012 RepID=UPI001C5A0E8E|nr:GNAT family N-acetyltransferase [Ferrimonas balearica]MBW3140172.1 GNAT family N-acetyltransferase [Ferrimonas balearica]MBY6106720.1 GNAT family N-acetyltransferase [Ferrimonas balearica]
MLTNKWGSAPGLKWWRFDALDVHQLYAVLRLREQVFMLEQNSLYEELDNLDQQSEHLLATADGELMGYLRLLAPADGPVKLGRIVLAKAARGTGLGPTLIREGLARAASQYPSRPVKISAQLALKDYYGQFGFVGTSEPYDDGGVLHLDMVKAAE